MHTFLPDVRHALRGLRQARRFSVMAIGTLALGIAAATAVFSLIDAVLLRPLPFAAPDRLVSLHERRGARVGPISAHELVAWRERNRVFDGIGLYLYSQFTMTGTGEPATVQALPYRPTTSTCWEPRPGSAARSRTARIRPAPIGSRY